MMAQTARLPICQGGSGGSREGYSSTLPMQPPPWLAVTWNREGGEGFSILHLLLSLRARARSHRAGGRPSLSSRPSLFRGKHRRAGAASTGNEWGACQPGNREQRSDARANALTAGRCERRSDGLTLWRTSHGLTLVSTGGALDAQTDGAALDAGTHVARLDAQIHIGALDAGIHVAALDAQIDGAALDAQIHVPALHAGIHVAALHARPHWWTARRSNARGKRWTSARRSSSNRSEICRDATSLDARRFHGSFQCRLEYDAPGNRSVRPQTEF